MEKDKLIPKRQTGGRFLIKFDKPLKIGRDSNLEQDTCNQQLQPQI